MNEIAFIIPGYAESKKNNPAYSKIAGYFKHNGIRPVIVEIDWKYKSMSEYVEQFQQIYLKTKLSGNVYFFGFSYGAMIAFVSSVRLKPKAQILCSLSPFFKEDIRDMREWWKKATGKKRLADLQRISFNDLAKQVSSKTILLAGAKEVKEVAKRVGEANRRIRNSRVAIVFGAKHSVQQKEYLAEIKKTIDGL